MFSHPGFYCIVAEQDGRIIGSNCMDERDAILGIGPITVDPAAQNSRVGRQLMDAVLQRAASRNPAGVRLVQAAFHNRSLSLYTKLGFDVREPLSVMQGAALGKKMDGCSVRQARLSDLEACNRVCRTVHGHQRGGELTDAISRADRRGGGTQRKDHRIRDVHGVLRTCGRGIEPGSSGIDRSGGKFRGARDSCAHKERGTVSLVPRRTACAWLSQ